MNDSILTKTNFTDADYLAEGFLTEEFIFDPEPDSEQLPLKTVCYMLTNWKDEFYTWTDGCWYRLSDSEMRMKITNYLQRRNINSSLGTVEHIPITLLRVNNIMLCLKGRCGRSEKIELNSWPDSREKIIYTLPCKNSLVCWDKGKKIKPVFMEHTPRFFNVSRLPYDYDPEKTCPFWLSFLGDVMLGRQEYIDVLQQFIGYLFRPDLREQKFLLCCGEGANGKGVFFEVVQNLVGKENCSQVSLTHFENRFALYETLGKFVNMTAESSHIIADEAENVLKSYVAGDTFTFERKFKDPVSAIPTAKLMISTNALPRFRDKTSAVWRRIILVPFDKIIPTKNQKRNLADLLKKELSGILNWALAGLERLNESGFIIPEANSQLIAEYRKDADPARAFLLDHYAESDNGKYVESKLLYEHYRQWCTESGFEAVNCRLFGQQIRRVFPKVKYWQAGTGTDRAYRYSGIGVKNES